MQYNTYTPNDINNTHNTTKYGNISLQALGPRI